MTASLAISDARRFLHHAAGHYLGNRVQLGVHATFGSPDLASAPPFFTHKLDAVRYALR